MFDDRLDISKKRAVNKHGVSCKGRMRDALVMTIFESICKIN